jgi:hypothetical protein
MSRIYITLATASLLVLVLANAVHAGTVTKTVTLSQGANTRSIALAPVSGLTVYRVTVTGPITAKVTVDLRGKAGSIKYPGIFTSTNTVKRLRIYTYRPLEAGQYHVVVAKKTGASATVRVDVASSPAKNAAHPKKEATPAKKTH